jgi:hypothetical protein
MPLIEPAHIDKLIAAFDPADSRPICVPVHAGRRGNPVLWSRRYIPDMLALLTGDQRRRAPPRHPRRDAIAEGAGRPPTPSFADFDTCQEQRLAKFGAGGREHGEKIAQWFACLA